MKKENNAEKIEVKIQPDYSYLTSSQAAEQIAIAILPQLSFIKSANCYWQYFRQPAFIKEHLLTLLQDAPFIGAPLKYWNYFTSITLFQNSITESDSQESLNRILSIPLRSAAATPIHITGCQHLPPTLQRVFNNLKGLYDNITLEGLSDAALEKSRAHLVAIMNNNALANAVGLSHGDHNRDKTLAIALLKEGLIDKGMFYALKTCQTLNAGLSMDEMLITAKYFIDKTKNNPLPETYKLLKMYAHSLFQLANYQEALKAYRSLAGQQQYLEDKFEAKRKIVRCLERLGDYDRAIKEANAFLPHISSPLYRAKLQRSLGWSHIRRGTQSDIAEAIRITQEALAAFDSLSSTMDPNDLLYNRARGYNNLGAAHELYGDPKNLNIASRYHNRCYKIMNNLGSMKWTSASLLNDSIVSRKLNKLDLSLKKASQAVQIRTWICDFDDLPPMLYNAAFARLRLYFKNRHPQQLSEAAKHLDFALLLQRQHAKNKTNTGLLSLQILCRLLMSQEETPAKQIRQINSINKNNKEEDKLPLFHKVVAAAYLKMGKAVPNNFNRALDEKELPSPENILKVVL